MTTTPSADTARDHDAQASSARADVYVEIVALARKGGSQAQFLRSAFQAIARHFGSPYACLHVRYASEVLQDDWHSGPTNPQFWKASLQQFLTESLGEPRSRARLLQARDGTTRVAFLSAPVFDPSGPAIGAMAVVLAPVEETALTGRLTLLESLTRLVSFSAEYLGGHAERESVAGQPAGSSNRAGDVKALSKAVGFSSHKELAYAIVNDLCNRLECEQVSLGIVRGRRIEVLAISGLDQVRAQSPGVVGLRAAMEECLDAGTTVAYQRNGNWSSSDASGQFRLHKQWHAQTQGDAVASIPLKAGESTVAVLSLRRRADEPFRPENLEDVRGRVEPFAAALGVLELANRGLLRHTCSSLRAAAGSLVRPDGVRSRLGAAIVVLVASIFAFGSMNYRVTVPCTVTPASVRHITAPFEGVLQTAAVLEGDRVSAGQTLCIFDHDDLEQQRAELQAELAVIDREMDQARAEGNPVELRLATARQTLFQTRLHILDRRIEQAVVRSPIDGVVVSGDLRKVVGAVLPQGEPLFVVAPANRWTLELAVPEHAADDVQPRLKGRFATFARPDRTQEFVLDRLQATARVLEGRNVYVAEAEVPAGSDELRPGMEGIARVEVGKRKIWWVALHRAVDYVRLHLWP